MLHKNCIAYNLTDVPFECVVVYSVYSSLKNDNNITYIGWECAFDFLLDARFHKELRDLLKKSDFVQKSRKQMLYGFFQALQKEEKLNTVFNRRDMYNFYILFAILQFIAIDDSKAYELAQNCVSTTSFQRVIDYLSIL